MRRMRGFTWYHVLFVIPVVALAFGVQYIVRKKYPQTGGGETTLAKPSYFRDKAPVKEVAQAQVEETDEVVEEETKTIAEAKPAKKAEKKADFGAPLVLAPKGLSKSASDAVKKIVSEEGMDRTPAAKQYGDVFGELSSGGKCMSIEYRGEGMTGTQITPKEWAKVVDQFLEVKKDLGDWLGKNRKNFPEKVALTMERRLRQVRLQKPPVAEEPDLAWRGIGVFAKDQNDNPIVRLSPGFVKLVTKQPTRSRFELARLIAQSWAPCELARFEAQEAWQPMLSCLNVKEGNACGTGSYSEGGWAVSTAIATIVAPPGCTVPAFAQPEYAQCVKKVPFPLIGNTKTDTASVKVLWKESRR